MEYTNPVISADFSDPDVIRDGEWFYLVSSSFNYVPGLPILKSKDLVHWAYAGYAALKLPERFNVVRPGEGLWAPSIRKHKGKFYILVPDPDAGIYMTSADKIEGPWSDFKVLLAGRGYEDPCPLWLDDKCYVVFAFAKSRIGFNSKLGLIEVNEDLSKVLSNGYEIIYDGGKENPTVEGPKCYLLNGKIVILAPAGGVEHGWETMLTADDIHGPYQAKTVLKESDNGINGPHQGALVDLNDKGDYAFIHFSDCGNLGRLVYLEPAVFKAGSLILGNNGEPVKTGNIQLKEENNFTISFDDSFTDLELKPIWQTPANVVEKGWIELKGGGLTMHAPNKINTCLRLFPPVLSLKIPYEDFQVSVQLISHLEFGEEAGLGIIGFSSGYVSLVRDIDSNMLLLSSGEGDKEDTPRFGTAASGSKFTLSLTFHAPDLVVFNQGEDGENGLHLKKEKWTGLHIGLFVRKIEEGQKPGFAIFRSFQVKKLPK
jgi:beta-xylosidase